MKRLICLVLCAVMLASACCVNAYAVDDGVHSNAEYYVDEYYEFVYKFYDNFMNGYYWPKYLTDDSCFGYVQVADDLRNNWYFQFCLSAVDFLTGISWSDFFNGEFTDDDTEIQNYVSALTSLLMTLETNMTDIRAEQAKADATMIWSDYLIEAGKVTAGAMTEITGDKSMKDIAGMNALQTAFTTCGIGIDIVGNTLGSFEQTQVLIENAETYLSYCDLLQVIIDNSDNRYLTTAADYLQKAADMCFEYRVKHLSDYADTSVNATSKYFFGVLDSVIEDAKAETALLTGELAALNYMNAAVQGIGSFKLGVDIGMFVGNVMIHSSDTILRYYEIIAMTDVRKALITEINARNTHIHSAEDWEQIENVCDLINDLLYVNARGEYCVYMIQSEDVGLYSWVNMLKNGDKVEDWFNTVMDYLRSTQQSLYGIFPNWEDWKRDEETTIEDVENENNEVEIDWRTAYLNYDFRESENSDYVEEEALITDCNKDGIPEIIAERMGGSVFYYVNSANEVCEIWGTGIEYTDSGCIIIDNRGFNVHSFSIEEYRCNETTKNWEKNNELHIEIDEEKATAYQGKADNFLEDNRMCKYYVNGVEYTSIDEAKRSFNEEYYNGAIISAYNNPSSISLLNLKNEISNYVS